MASYRIAVMAGDGIGPEVVGEAVKVLKAVQQAVSDLNIETVNLPAGLEAYERYGSTLPDSTLETLGQCDGWFLGPVSTYAYTSGMVNPSMHLRKTYELYANIRPLTSFPGVKSLYSNVDLVIVRENTEGFYADRNVLGGNGELLINRDTVVSVRVITRQACLRSARTAFNLARRRGGLCKVTAVHKANVLKKGCGLFLEACREVAKDYPDITLEDFMVDAFAMHLVMRPRDFDVVVATNLFGDVLSDEAAGLVGGLGLAPGLNAGEVHVMAQAVHGSAPDIAGRGIANPVAEILSAQMLLDWLAGKNQDVAARTAAERIKRAVSQVLAEGKALTPDMGGTASTEAVGDAIAQAVI